MTNWTIIYKIHIRLFIIYGKQGTKLILKIYKKEYLYHFDNINTSKLCSVNFNCLDSYNLFYIKNYIYKTL